MRVKLGEVCDINPKIQVTDDHVEVSFVPMQNVSEDGIIYLSETRLYGEVKKGFTSFHNGDVLFAKITPCMENGKGGIVKNLKNGLGFGSTEFHVLRPHSDIVLSDWLYYLTSWPVFRKECEKNMTGSAGQKRVPKSFLEEYKLFLPPLETQRHIAAVLDKVSDLIAKRRQQLDKLDELVKARFVEMFGDPVDNPMGWEKKPIVEICEKILSGGTPSKDHEEYFKGDIPWVSPKDMKTLVINDSQDHITEDAVQNSSTKIVPENSVLMVIRSGILKHTLPVAINTVPVAINQDMKAFVIQNTTIRPEYLLYYFKQVAPDILHGVRGVTADNIDFKTFQRRVIIVPSVKLQNQFAAFVTQTEKTKAAVQQALEKLETMKKALMQEYFG